MFATGGIGGVHRGASESFDISADIGTLAQTNILLVCAGVKTVLDIPKTLEAFETASVTVLTLSPDDGEFPSFYTRKSGVRTPDSVPTERDAAEVVSVQLRLGGPGTLLAVPVPRQFEADAELIANAVQESIDEAKERGVSGREATPFLLGRIAAITSDQSLHANVELVKNNAAVASRIASYLCSLNTDPVKVVARQDESISHRRDERVEVVIAGGCAVDVTATVAGPMQRGTSNPGKVLQSVGGVGRNVMSAAMATGARCLLISSVGEDLFGSFVISQLRQAGVRTDGVNAVAGTTTATYVAVNESRGDLDTAVADMSIFDTRLPSLEALSPLPSVAARALQMAKFLCIDGNLHPDDISALCRQGRAHNVSIWFEPVSVAKSRKIYLAGAESFAALSYVSPNLDELTAMWSQLRTNSGQKMVPIETADKMAFDLLREHHRLGGESLSIVCTLGAKGACIYQRARQPPAGAGFDASLYRVRLPAAPIPGGVIRSTNGAGDVLAGTMIGELLKSGVSVELAAKRGMAEAALHCAGGFRASRL